MAAVLVMMVPRIPAERRAQGGIRALVDGLRFLRAPRVILAVLSLDFFATFFGSPRALLPVYADQILHVGPQGLGVLAAATSIGAVALAPFTGIISRIRRQGMGVALAIVGWGLFILAFRPSTAPLCLSAFFLAGGGAAGTVGMGLR